MPILPSRRRAIVRGLMLCGALLLSTRSWSGSAAAQESDPSSDPPDADPTATPVVQVPGIDGTPGPAPVMQNPEDEPLEEPTPAAASTGPWGAPPVKLMIPALGVEAAVEAVGQEPDGTMSAPTHPDEVAWYELGPGMGVPGNVVFAGHVNWDGRVRAFGYLDQLAPGDVVQVIDDKGRGYEYVVDGSRWFRAEGAPLEQIFHQPNEPIITLITCGGEYVASRREYLDRLIVTARGA
jgi:hypothetical protein